MRITEIKRKGKSEEYYVYVDEEFYGLMQAEYIVKYKLKSGLEIDREELDKIKLESDRLTCSTKALGYVSKMLRSEFQVRTYLKKHGYEQSAIDETIEKLKNYGYINDEYMAKMVADSLTSRKGKNYIKKDLMQKGIKQREIENIISNLPSGEGVAKQLAKKWIKNKTLPLDQKDKAKLYRFLAGKGFDFEEIKSATKDLNMESNDDWC